MPVRVLEQIKLDVAHDNLPVVFIGDGNAGGNFFTAEKDASGRKQMRLFPGGKAVLFGHDWGAPIVWNTALIYPEKITAVATIPVPTNWV